MATHAAGGAPVEPPRPLWEFPDVTDEFDHELIGIGADLAPATVLAAYRRGLFPMPLGPDVGRPGPIGWWSPNPRGILMLSNLRVTRSLRRSMRRYHTTINRDFVGVIDACRTTPREGGWISEPIRDAYVRLHELGWAHSVETWNADDELVGGLYGIGTHALFAGESMFSWATDASKVALVALTEALTPVENILLDVQWQTPHLASMGVTEVARELYLKRLSVALTEPSDQIFRILHDSR